MPPAPAGTVGARRYATGGVTAASGPYAANTAGVRCTFTADFGSGAQTIQLNLGTYGQIRRRDAIRRHAYSLRGLTQNGVPPGSFSCVTTQANGNIVVNYDNGQTRTIAQVPLITFNNPNQLQRQDGQAFTATVESGTPLAEQASTNGAGNLVIAIGRELQRRYRHRVLQADRRAAGLLGQHQDGDHGRRHAAADDRHEALRTSVRA